MIPKSGVFILGLLLFQVTEIGSHGANVPDLSFVVDGQPGPAAAHGLRKLLNALQAKSVSCQQVTQIEAAEGRILVLAGLASGTGPAAQFITEEHRKAPLLPESVIIAHSPSWRGKPTWAISGTDDRGLMYAELDAADRVAWAEDSRSPFSEVREITEQPDVPTRAISIYTMNRAYWESRFYDEAYWARYLDTIAENRFNSLVVIFGYENGGFLAPCYPYFFDVKGFPDVQMVGITTEQQERNLTALNRLIQIAHDHGVELTVGIWDHIYRGGVQAGGVPGAQDALKKPTPGLVWGVTAENLLPYTKAALAEFVHRVPHLDAIQFRMHDESGLKNSEQQGFWKDVFQLMKEQAPNLRLDLRAKGLPNEVIQDALQAGVKFRITTKYWMEQMGLPFHPTHINTQDQQNRRHSYADLLRYPQSYKMHWRLWNGGTARVLLWGDPEYARRFVASTHLYDGDGFEVNEPLCTKMEAQPHDATPFDLLTPAHRYYDYEFERYWHFFQVFGRVGYNPQTSSEAWDHEFERRFGSETARFVEDALHKSSWILPRIVAACYPYNYFPMTRGWAEKQRLGNLAAYAQAEGSDLEQFASFDEEARLLLEHGETAKTRPAETSRWFARTAMDITRDIVSAQERIGQRRSKEFDSTIADLKILCNLALYHSRRIPAAVSYRLLVRTQDPQALDDAISYERGALESWRALVASAGDFYTADLMMGVRSAGLCGHWKDELSALEEGLGELIDQKRRLVNPMKKRVAPPYTVALGEGDNRPPAITHRAVTEARLGNPVTITAEVRDVSGVKWVHLRFRGVNQRLEYQTLPMLPNGETDQYQAVIPAERIDPQFDLMYFIEAMDAKGNGKIYPDLNMQTPYVVVRLSR